MTVLRRHRVAAQDIDELTDRILRYALALGRTPATLAGCVELLRTMARRAALDELRKQQSVDVRVGARTARIASLPPGATAPDTPNVLEPRSELEDATIRDTWRAAAALERLCLVLSPRRSEFTGALVLALAVLAVVGCAAAWWLRQ